MYENEDIEGTHIKYKLYEANYLAAMGDILRSAINRENTENKKENKKYSEESNLFPFIGKRGAGKTTAMNEFADILSQMQKEDVRNWWIEHSLKEEEREKLYRKSFRFHVLGTIDASLMEKSEELFELILVKLYREYEKLLADEDGRSGRKEWDIRRINSLFEELLKMYRSVQGKRGEEEQSIAYMVSSLASSSELSEKIGELLDELIKLWGENYDYEYLVIAIDDLDLNLENGYNMLEQLQKYFHYSKILILVALDYEQMGLVCEKHFYEAMKGLAKEYNVAGIDMHSRELANDYMTKVFPLSQRVFMPDMKKLTKKARILENGKEISIKNYILIFVADAMRIFYDCKGVKRHFCEPDTVRNLVSYNSFLYDLMPVDYAALVKWEKLSAKKGNEAKKNERLLRAYDYNHGRFNWDISERQAQMTLNPFQQKAFKTLLERDLERRAMYFVNIEREDELIEIKDMTPEQYSYGQLLGKVYAWGRKHFIDKPLISCILASFTSEMVREYIIYRYHPEKSIRNNAETRLKGFLGKSFGNEWIGEVFPKVNLINEQGNWEEVQSGYATQAEQNSLELRFSVSRLIENENWRDLIEQWCAEEEIVPVLECIDMFLIGKENDKYIGSSYRFEMQNRMESPGKESLREDAKGMSRGVPTKKEKKVLVIYGGTNRLTFDAMAFVAKSFDYEGHIKELHEKIAAGIGETLGKFFGIYNQKEEMEALTNRLKEAVKANSLLLDGTAYGKLPKDIAFPFYNLDLSYNVIKRLRKQNVKIKRDALFKNLCMVYAEIGKELEEEGKFYRESKKYSGRELAYDYDVIYRECPYIRMLHKIEEKKMTGVQEMVTDALIKIYPREATAEQPSD